LLILGDFNLPTVIFPNKTVFSEGTIQNEFERTCTNLGLFQLVKHPTLGKYILDLLFTPLKASVTVVEVREPFSTSDHNCVYFEVLDSYDEPPHPVKKDFCKADYVAINQQLQGIIWPELFSDCANIDDFYVKFSSLLNMYTH